jgi:hypothetical protein
MLMSFLGMLTIYGSIFLVSQLLYVNEKLTRQG